MIQTIMMSLTMFGYMYGTCTFFAPTCSDQVHINLPYRQTDTCRIKLIFRVHPLGILRNNVFPLDFMVSRSGWHRNRGVFLLNDFQTTGTGTSKHLESTFKNMFHLVLLQSNIYRLLVRGQGGLETVQIIIIIIIIRIMIITIIIIIIMIIVIMVVVLMNSSFDK